MSKDLQTKFQSYLEDLQSKETDNPDSTATVAAPDTPSETSPPETETPDDASTPPIAPVITFDTETPPQS
ncbi:MAG: hypothetical protein ACKOX2_06000, partial [Microcystaceae cyanobacterium]